MSNSLLNNWVEAISLIKRTGGTINVIQTDDKTLDRLWFEMSKLDIRQQGSGKRRFGQHVEIMGVVITSSGV